MFKITVCDFKSDNEARSLSILCQSAICVQILFCYAITGNEFIMPLIGDHYCAVIIDQFEHGNFSFRHELDGYRTAKKVWKTFLTPSDVLNRLDDAMLVVTAFCLHRNDELAPVFVDSHIDLVDFNLPDVGDFRPKMVLERIGSNSEKQVDQTIVADFGKKCLFVTKGVTTNDFWCRIRNLYRDQILVLRGFSAKKL